MTAWAIFIASSALIVLAAVKLAEYGDAISVRTKLGGMFIGTLFLAAATSLPELLTTISSLDQNSPNLAAGNLLGSGMANMLFLAFLEIFTMRFYILRRIGMQHALTAALGVMLTGMVVFYLMADIDIRLGWVGLDSLSVLVAYLIGFRLIQSGHTGQTIPPEPVLEEAQVPGLAKSIIGFAIATAALVVVTPYLVSSSISISEQTGIRAGFIGTTLVAFTTSLPELVTVIAAARLGAYDLAVGNLFGSNLFNMFALGLTDVFYTEGRFLGNINPGFGLVGMLVILMTALGLISSLSRSERKFLSVKVDAILLILIYFGGMWLLYTKGIGA